VVLDLMIHDLDIILSTVKSKVKRISASGVAIVSETPDITNARIEFENGCVANLTASRISLKNMRKSRFFQGDAYISIDFLTKESEVVKLTTLTEEPDPFDIVFDLGEGKQKKKIEIFKPEILPTNAIKEELETFALSVLNDTRPVVSIEDGEYALNIALQIMDKLKLTGNLIQENIQTIFALKVNELYEMIKKILLLFSVSLFFLGCTKEDLTPSWLKIEPFTLTTDPSSQGVNSHAITNVWLFMDSKSLGVFELPCVVPILDEGNHTFELIPGVKNNGISAKRIQYPFYKIFKI
jgi:hypothetical protein